MGGSRRLWWLWFPLGALVLVAVAWLSWYGVARWQASRIKDEIRAAGLPITEAEIIPAEIPDDENAAPLLKRAETIWKKLSEREGFIAVRVGSNAPGFAPEMFDKDRIAQLQVQMRRPETQEFFRLMHEAAGRPAAVFDRDYSKGHGTDIGPLIPLFSAVQQLASRSWLAASCGVSTRCSWLG